MCNVLDSVTRQRQSIRLVRGNVHPRERPRARLRLLLALSGEVSTAEKSDDTRLPAPLRLHSRRLAQGSRTAIEFKTPACRIATLGDVAAGDF
jgi:hypothetical protein